MEIVVPFLSLGAVLVRASFALAAQYRKPERGEPEYAERL